MKKIPLFLLALLLSLSGARAQTIGGAVNLTFDLGVLRDAEGNPLPDGALIQVLANLGGTSSIAAPLAGDYLGGSNAVAVLWSGGLDSSVTGLAGATTLALINVPLYTSDSVGNYLTAGDALFVRWFPSLTAASSVPGYTSYGQYGYTDSSGLLLDPAWTIPAAGNPMTYRLLTTDVGGSLDGSFGEASLNIAAIPEPSVTALATALAAIGICVVSRRRRRG